MMKRLLSPLLPRSGHPVSLSEKEAHHALRVLRLVDGSKVEVLDGKGNHVLALLRLHKDQVELEYAGEASRESTLPLPLILEMSLLKGEAMEWVVEKAVELGVHQFVPLLSSHSVVQVKKKGPEVFQSRWQKIADQALKQCGRLERMQVQPPLLLEDLLHQASSQPPLLRFWCDEAGRHDSTSLLKSLEKSLASVSLSQTIQPLKSLRLLVGPEGGWSHTERELLKKSEPALIRRVHLGPLVLRAETAALFGISVIVAYMREKFEFPDIQL